MLLYRPVAQCGKKRCARASKPPGMRDEIAFAGHAGFLFGVQHAQKIVGFGKGKFGVAEREHRGQRRAFFACERADGLVSVKQGEEVIVMHGGILAVRRIVDEREPIDNVAFDGVRQVVYSIGSIAEAEVNGRSGSRIGAVIAP